MAANQFDKMSVKELSDLESRIKNAIFANKERDRAAVKQKVDAILDHAGLGVEDLAALYGLSPGRGARKGKKIAPKYHNPDNKLETWTGRGLQPRWLVAKLSKGGNKIGDFVINPAG